MQFFLMRMDDGSIDLYVVSGGNEFLDGNPSLGDHLYINDGKGILVKRHCRSCIINKSTVSVADIDKDGDMDVFMGGLADAKTYGYPQSSWLLINDGKGQFKIAEEKMINLKNIGITTTSEFIDLNKDGWDRFCRDRRMDAGKDIHEQQRLVQG